MRVAALAALSVSALLVLASCDDLSRFDTADGARYRGMVIGGAGASFVRRGFLPETELELEFHPELADTSGAGTLTTHTPDGSARVFDGTPLEAIAPLQHDVLSEYSFPGAARAANYLYLARPASGPLATREVYVFVSLIEDGEIEVRVLAGGGDEEGDHFGVFRLRRAGS